jgi:hypothetical protein
VNEAIDSEKEIENEMIEKTCKWTGPENEWDEDVWQSSCEAEWQLTIGGPKDNGMNFCPVCGKPLITEGEDDEQKIQN